MEADSNVPHLMLMRDVETPKPLAQLLAAGSDELLNRHYPGTKARRAHNAIDLDNEEPAPTPAMHPFTDMVPPPCTCNRM